MLLDIIGPVMVGPSSSHTAGAVRLGRLARVLLGEEPARARLTLHGSFAATHRGHGTDLALVGGLLGLGPADEGIRQALELARQRGMQVEITPADLGDVHPNTVRFELRGEKGRQLSLWGSSLGAGRVEVFRLEDFPVSLTGEYPTLVLFHRDRPGVIASVTSLLAKASLNIARMRVTRSGRGGRALTVLELDQTVDETLLGELRRLAGVGEALAVDPVEGFPLPPFPPASYGTEENGGEGEPDFTSLAELAETAERKGVSLGILAWQRESRRQGIEPSALREAMRDRWRVMEQAARRGLEEAPRSRSGLVGGDGARVEQVRAAGRALGGDFLAAVLARALAVAEVNAAMGVIVAAPTAGSCGVLPGVLLVAKERLGSGEEQVLEALFTAGAVGAIIASRATLAGAAGGCQAECGAAAAMAAAAATELAGGSPTTAAHAAALALKGLLGLVCDPVGGLVEVPCVKRNALAAAVAVAAADLALAGVKSFIPPDEVIEALAEVGRALPVSLRETAQGGLAATPTARACACCRPQ